MSVIRVSPTPAMRWKVVPSVTKTESFGVGWLSFPRKATRPLSLIEGAKLSMLVNPAPALTVGKMAVVVPSETTMRRVVAEVLVRVVKATCSWLFIETPLSKAKNVGPVLLSPDATRTEVPSGFQTRSSLKVAACPLMFASAAIRLLLLKAGA